jgi:hypothetical protein
VDLKPLSRAHQVLCSSDPVALNERLEKAITDLAEQLRLMPSQPVEEN